MGRKRGHLVVLKSPARVPRDQAPARFRARLSCARRDCSWISSQERSISVATNFFSSVTLYGRSGEPGGGRPPAGARGLSTSSAGTPRSLRVGIDTQTICMDAPRRSGERSRQELGAVIARERNALVHHPPSAREIRRKLRRRPAPFVTATSRAAGSRVERGAELEIARGGDVPPAGVVKHPGADGCNRNSRRERQRLKPSATRA